MDKDRQEQSQMLKTTFVKIKIAPTYKFLWQEEAKKEGLPLSVIIRREMNRYFKLSE